MPLPPALAARLAKRGLIQETPKVQEVEEVFVEHYDEQTEEDLEAKDNENESHEEKVDEDGESKEYEEEEEEAIVHECVNCPNKTNPYHDCVKFCREQWGVKKFEHLSELDKKKKKMLRKYPLPDTWLEVGDPETSRFYYWNTETEEVSWLPPLHPKAHTTLPDEKLKEIARLTAAEESGSESSSDSESSDDSGAEDEEVEEEMDIDDFEEIEKRVLNEKREKEKKLQEEGNKKGRKKRQEQLDPMDPASYSDIPRGTWSTGLETKGSAKTGVDATASGPLFQQRPYPSPGAVLRMNKPAE